MNDLMKDLAKASEVAKVGAFLTARQMALRAHSLSRDGMTAVDNEGARWGWSNHFSVWACVTAQ